MEAVDGPFEESCVIYEPYSGVAFQSTLYLQANYFYEPDLLFTYPQACLLPVFTINRSGNLTQETADKLFQPLMDALQAKIYVFYIGIGVAVLGFLMTVFAIVKIVKFKRVGPNAMKE